MKSRGGPTVIALAYYDGATEGFLCSPNRRAKYFCVVAQDDLQDSRLFAVSDVLEDDVRRLVRLLKKTQQVPVQSTWVARWLFEADDERDEADAIVYSARCRLVDNYSLVLANHIEENASIEVSVEQPFAAAIREALQANAVLNLRDINFKKE